MCNVNTSGWKHSICDKCWGENYAACLNRGGPHRTSNRTLQVCCFCGEKHRSGVFICRDPQDEVLKCKGQHVRMQQSKVEIYDASDRAVWHRRRIMDDGCFCVAMQLRLTGHWYLRIHYHFSSDVSIVQPVVRLRELALKRYSKAALAKPDRFAQDGYKPKRDCWCIPLVPKRWCHAH